MKIILLISSLLLSASALADTLQMPTTAQPGEPLPADYSQLPPKGMLQSAVLEQYGEPLSMNPPVGDPPISRWIYPNMIVFFEHDHVINAVIPGKPRPIYNREELRRGGVAP